MVVTRSGNTTVHAAYRVRSARQRLGLTLPADFQLDTQPLRVNGERRDLERGDKNELFIPLLNKAAGEPLVIELRYTLPRGASRLDLPEFLDEPAVQQVFLAVYVPEEQAMLGARGPWTEEFDWRWSIGDVPVPMARQADQEFLHSLESDVQLERPIGDDFPIDGTRYVFSTLRPEAAPKGSLSLTTIRREYLQAFTIAAAVGLWFAGMRRGLQQRLTLLIFVVGGLLVLSVFLTTFVRQLADHVLVWSLVLVVAAWSVRSIYQLIRESKRWLKRAAGGANDTDRRDGPSPPPVEQSPFRPPTGPVPDSAVPVSPAAEPAANPASSSTAAPPDVVAPAEIIAPAPTVAAASAEATSAEATSAGTTSAGTTSAGTTSAGTTSAGTTSAGTTSAEATANPSRKYFNADLLSGFALKAPPAPVSSSSPETSRDESSETSRASDPAKDDDSEIQIVDDEPKGRGEGGSSHA
jgi:hypothetical protein